MSVAKKKYRKKELKKVVKFLKRRSLHTHQSESGLLKNIVAAVQFMYLSSMECEC